MYFDLIKFPIQHENLKWEAAEALLDMRGKPHLFVRIKLSGTQFPVVAQIPHVWVGKVYARRVTIDDDRRTARAYFDQPLPRDEELYFGHAGHAELAFGRFDPKRIVMLDRTRLPKDVIFRREQ